MIETPISTTDKIKYDQIVVLNIELCRNKERALRNYLKIEVSQTLSDGESFSCESLIAESLCEFLKDAQSYEFDDGHIIIDYSGSAYPKVLLVGIDADFNEADVFRPMRTLFL